MPVFSEPGDPVMTAAKGLAEARRLGRDVLIVDTAGRLAIDTEMMEQVRMISGVVAPHYTFLVIDAMTGQDAVGVAEVFNDTLAIDGVILSKLDGDARGGAALSVKEVIGKPIAFASTGEKLDAFEQFHPDRMAGRILGMGDVLTLIEQAEQAFEKDQAEEAASKLMEGAFTLDDFLEQMQQLKKMGPARQPARDDAGHAQGAQGRPDRRRRPQAGRGDHPLDDARGAGDAAAHQRVPAHPHRQRLGHHAVRRQPPRQAVRRDAEDDEALRRWMGQGQEGQARRRLPGLPPGGGFPDLAELTGGGPGFPQR